jgi:NADPH-dependent curcumin reductase CurA
MPAGVAGSPEKEGAQGGGKQVKLVKRPVGDFQDDDFEVVETPVPEEPGPGNAVVKNLLIALEPTHRIWASDADQYMPPVGLGHVMRAMTVGKVVKSSDPAKMAVGTYVSMLGGVQEYCVLPIAALAPVVPDIPLSYNYSLFSVVIGLTAWVGTNICEPKKGKTMVVSSAASAVGSIAGQIAKARGAKVVGIAGSAEKCAWLIDDLGFDGAINYKTEKLDERLDQLCPEGVDCFFDNVGGTTLETLLKKMNNFSAIACCGLVSGYNAGADQTATVKNYEMILMRRIKIQGFICSDHVMGGGIEQAYAEFGALLKQGKMKIREDIQEVGLEHYVKTLQTVYSGENKGKLFIKLPEN